MYIVYVRGRRVQNNEIFLWYVKELGLYSQCNKGFIVRILTGKIIWLDLHFREKTGRERLVVCQIWWSCQSLPIWVPMNKLSFLHFIHKNYCEQELNFYCIKPLKFGNVSVTAPSTTSLSNRHWWLEYSRCCKQNSEYVALVWWISEYKGNGSEGKEKLVWGLFSLETK